MNFEEPKVEVISLDRNVVVFASPDAGGAQSCKGSWLDSYEQCGYEMDATSADGCGNPSFAWFDCGDKAASEA